MLKITALRARAWRALAFVVAATLLAGLGSSLVLADDPISVVKVEEYWELVVAEADADRDAPQVTCVISPTGDLNGTYAAFELNHQSQPSYVGGGLQLQVWNANEVPAATRTQKTGENLVNAGETITWKQKMELVGGQLTFSVPSGTSTSWGAFGDALTASVATTLTNLNGYSPLVSVNGSGPGFGSHRVTSLKLTKVKLHLSTGQILEDATVKVAFPKT